MTVALPPDEGERVAAALWEATHPAPWEYAAGWQQSQYRRMAVGLIASADERNVNQDDRATDLAGRLLNGVLNVSTFRDTLIPALEEEWIEGYQQGREDEIENLAEARAPYEAVLKTWEQSGDVTRMWLAREFREALEASA